MFIEYDCLLYILYHTTYCYMFNFNVEILLFVLVLLYSYFIIFIPTINSTRRSFEVRQVSEYRGAAFPLPRNMEVWEGGSRCPIFLENCHGKKKNEWKMP